VKKHVPYWIIILFFASFCSVIVWYNIAKPRVLVLHSYDANYPWSRDVTVGINRVLSKKTYAIRWYYMDAKRHPGKESKESAGKGARALIDNWRPDVIIAVDDDAQEYVAKKYADRKDIKIVFAGLNGGHDLYGYDKATNVTGILERKWYPAMKHAILTIHQSDGKRAPVRVMNISDNSESVQKDEIFLKAFDWSPVVLMESRLVKTMDEWKLAVKDANAKADFIITDNYRKLLLDAGKKVLMKPGDVIKWTMANTTIPIIGTNGFIVEDGGMLAIATSPFEQGEVAAGMAVQIIDKKVAPKDIPVVSTKQFVVYMNKKKLNERGITMPGIYEAFARATNNYFE